MPKRMRVFYRGFKSKTEAKEFAKFLRTPKGAIKHGTGYPLQVTVSHISSSSRFPYGVYAYQTEKTRLSRR